MIALVATVFFVTWLFDFYQERFDAADPAPSPLAEMREDETVPGPHLQQSPRSEMNELRDKDREILDTSAWLDEQKKIAREPIDLAMEQVARDGLPKWPRVAEPDAKDQGGTVNESQCDNFASYVNRRSSVDLLAGARILAAPKAASSDSVMTDESAERRILPKDCLRPKARRRTSARPDPH